MPKPIDIAEHVVKGEAAVEGIKAPQTPPEVIEEYRKEHGEHDSCTLNCPAFARFPLTPNRNRARA
jgi:hypothetical protein